MKTATRHRHHGEQGSILAYFIVVALAATGIASVGTYVAHSTRMSLRRSNLVSATQYAIGGAVIACSDLNLALTNSSSGGLGAKLGGLATPYRINSTLSTSSNTVYERTISAPFTGQTVLAQVWVPAGSSPSTARIVGNATVGGIAQKSVVNVTMGWGYPAAIISVNNGTSSRSVDKGTGQDGNVVINGSRTGPIIVDGNVALAALANGRVNYDTNYVYSPPSSYSMTNRFTANQVPDYTSQGASNALFDVKRFIAVADKTPGGVSPSGNNHFTNITDFIKAAKSHPGGNNSMEGVIVVDVWESDRNLGNLTDTVIPNGINVRGTLMLNFLGPGWDPVTEKIIVTATLNLNPADLTGLVATNPATYPSGYPPVYKDPTKNPANIDISPSFQNFSSTDDLPAEIYTIGCLDMHGNANICGVCYTPSYMEIENKKDGQIQYIRGACIMGNGIYYENNCRSTSIISFDPRTLDSLVTIGGAGKQVKVAYWE